MKVQRTWFRGEDFLDDFEDTGLDEFFERAEDTRSKKIYIAA